MCQSFRQNLKVLVFEKTAQSFGHTDTGTHTFSDR